MGSINFPKRASPTWSVHPHLRGEHDGTASAASSIPGSSPPAWGACGIDQAVPHQFRFIPTCVGSIHAPPRAGQSPPVHPHLRGEHGSGGLTSSSFGGSSPPAWGAFFPRAVEGAQFRFIPTCVGSMRWLTPKSLDISVHPHLRGEHWFFFSHTQKATGSSPPAWGACSSSPFAVVDYRFIPTCVGSMRRCNRGVRQWPVHPHLRGEHINCEVRNVDTGGSSPPAWGALRNMEFLLFLLRFIPTCVGSMARRINSSMKSPVHPHLRGEHVIKRELVDIWRGSSPPAWGACQIPLGSGRPFRFIPTCVGSICSSAGATGSGPVHPHLRGEHPRINETRRAMTGSSPPAWGACIYIFVHLSVQRFIPTCVGSMVC